MKKIFLALTALTIILTSCSKEEEATPELKIEKKVLDDGGDKKDMSGWD